jgi:hypothetical protein
MPFEVWLFEFPLLIIKDAFDVFGGTNFVRDITFRKSELTP